MARLFPGLRLHGGVPVREWGSERHVRRVEWLRKWCSYYQSVALAEMMEHRFLNPERSIQRVEFDGVPGFKGE